MLRKHSTQSKKSKVSRTFASSWLSLGRGGTFPDFHSKSPKKMPELYSGGGVVGAAFCTPRREGGTLVLPPSCTWPSNSVQVTNDKHTKVVTVAVNE